MDLTLANAPQWLAEHDLDPTGATFTALGGGVSNQVILAETREQRLVIKQSFGQLRVEQEWLSDRTRIAREAAAMRWVNASAVAAVPGVRIPRVLVEDTENFALAMEAAPPEAEMWKTRLFAGHLETEPARRAGLLLGTLVSASYRNANAIALFGDQTCFDQLRIDPYYRATARRHPNLATWFEQLMADSAARAIALTHGDWSPKNLLVTPDALWAIDWEVIHYGDPAFDVAFLLNHLLLKSLVMPELRVQICDLARNFLWAFNSACPEEVALNGATCQHLPALLLARVDGKSPAEYLTDDMRRRAAETAIDAIQNPLQHPLEIFDRCR